MIAPAPDTDFRQLKDMPVTGIMDKIISVYYPQLSALIGHMDATIAALSASYSMAGKAMLDKVREELGGMISKEKMILFPLLLLLEKEDRKSDCGPFKLVKKHYQSLLSVLPGIRYLLEEDTAPGRNTLKAIKQVNDLELHIMALQRAKEKYLFNRFKSCNNDCQITAYASLK